MISNSLRLVMKAWIEGKVLMLLVRRYSNSQLRSQSSSSLGFLPSRPDEGDSALPKEASGNDLSWAYAMKNDL
jgi:hypothetical protein